MNSSLFDALLQSMRDRFPKLSWKLGSVIRTLLLEPLVSISDEITKYSDKLANISNIKAFLDDPQIMKLSWITGLKCWEYRYPKLLRLLELLY